MAAYIESWRTLEHEEVHLQGDMWILLEVQKGDLGQAIGSATIHVADKCRTPANGCEAHHSSRGTYHRQLKDHSSGKLQDIQCGTNSSSGMAAHLIRRVLFKEIQRKIPELR
ncbi:hypothetical protein LINPERPRIM_LOCUS35446 [Linum perenne]